MTDDRDARIELLEETIRGVLQEKQKLAATMRDSADCFVGTTKGEAYEAAAREFEQQAAWLESVLGGNQ